jgi:hypothetical protein
MFLSLAQSNNAASAALLRRAILLAITLLGVVATAWLVGAMQTAKQTQRDQRFAEGWRTQAISEPKSAVAPMIAQWGMRDESSTEGRALSWSVADLSELRASLLALDNASVTVRKITVNKRDSGLAIVAELAP